MASSGSLDEQGVGFGFYGSVQKVAKPTAPSSGMAGIVVVRGGQVEPFIVLWGRVLPALVSLGREEVHVKVPDIARTHGERGCCQAAAGC